MKRILIVIDGWELDLKNLVSFPISDWAGMLRRIRKFIKSRKDIDTVIFASHGKNTSRILTSVPGKRVYATTINEIKSFLDDPSIDGVFLAGMAWDVCVRNRELGYLNLYKFTSIAHKDLLIKDDCVMYSGERDSIIFDPLDNPDWIRTEEIGVYKYSPK